MLLAMTWPSPDRPACQLGVVPATLWPDGGLETGATDAVRGAVAAEAVVARTGAGWDCGDEAVEGTVRTDGVGNGAAGLGTGEAEPLRVETGVRPGIAVDVGTVVTAVCADAGAGTVRMLKGAWLRDRPSTISPTAINTAK